MKNCNKYAGYTQKIKENCNSGTLVAWHPMVSHHSVPNQLMDEQVSKTAFEVSLITREVSF